MFKALTSGTQLPFPLFLSFRRTQGCGWDANHVLVQKWREKSRERERERGEATKSKSSHISFVYYFISVQIFFKGIQSCSFTWKTIKILPQIKACDPHSHSGEDWGFMSVPVCLFREYSESSNEWIKFFKKERKKERKSPTTYAMWLERSEWLVSREWSENTDTDHHFLHGDDNAWILVVWTAMQSFSPTLARALCLSVLLITHF